KKYGLGSSAAVTVATVKALCAFYELSLSNDQLYKLAAIAHLDVQGNGSLGDIAASVFGGWVAYRSFDKQWLADIRPTVSLTELLEMPWPSLSIELLTPPAELSLLIGWTGSPASTSHLVDKIALAKTERQADYQNFLAASKACLEAMVEGFRRNDLAQIQAELRHNRAILQDLAHFSHVAIETPILLKMGALAEAIGGAAKTSGAGGGDCGIVIIDRAIETEALFEQWRANQIERLNLAVHLVD
ncbi:phosphomevalonate kinase, partial [Latilactobacillus curvatus]|uniref:phosphomevalonate kinase n=2 Tax=Lactobacillaceae TaxID=33958 RepID=UPI00057428F0